MELMRRRDDRIPSVPRLISYIQSVTEREKAVLARELHDELGGLLVAASMDLAWLDKHLTGDTESLGRADGGAAERNELRRRLNRMKETVAGAVDIKRRIIEELRPTLLDNVGLFAALRWLVNSASAHAQLAMSIKFPSREPHFKPEVSIALFRIAQEGLALITEYRWVRSVALRLDCDEHLLTLSITGFGEQVTLDAAPPQESFELATIRHRSAVLGGGIRFSTSLTGEVGLFAWIPVESALGTPLGS
jgi:signal transduction histidine kinase